MTRTISKKISVKAPEAKTSGQPLTGDKNLGLNTVIRSYAIEESDETEEG